mgnify:FL=1
MNLKTNPYPAELLLRLYGTMGRKPIHPKEGPAVAELIKDYYNQISNLQREGIALAITLTQEKGMLEQENKFLIAQVQEEEE